MRSTVTRIRALMEIQDEAQVRELFRKAREIKNPENNLGDSLAERYLIDDFFKLMDALLESEYERGYSDAEGEAYDEYDMEDARDTGYEDGVRDTKRKYNIEDDED